MSAIFDVFIKITLFTACIHTHYESTFETEEGEGVFEYDLRWIRQGNLLIEESRLNIQMNGYSLDYYFRPDTSYLAVWNNGSLRIHYNLCGGKNCLDTRKLPCNDAAIKIIKNDVYAVVDPKDIRSLILHYYIQRLVSADYKNISIIFDV